MEEQDIRLLVVDDDEHNRDILSRQLRRRGYEILTAENGERALAAVASQQSDLLTLDILMPGIDGVEVLRRLRRSYSPAELPIIMATAKMDSQNIVRTAELGANDHVGKPLDFDVLTAKVEAHLRLKAASAPARPAAGEPTLDELQAGSVIAGRYRLDEKIGAGTFGTVYKALHQDLDLEVAIKVLEPGLTADHEALERFRREGVAACRLRHPNAVAVSDFGVTATGVAFLVMELLQGRSLADELESQGTLSPRRANEILQPVCDVLAEAHAKGLIHRDVKPENIYLHRTRDGEVVKVLDFGIAKLDDEAGHDPLTADGLVIGTPGYMAPERLFAYEYDGRADVFSLGVILFVMLTGHRPLRSPRQYSQLELRSVAPELPVELEEPIVRALSRDPGERPDAATLARTFARGVEQIGPAADVPTTTSRDRDGVSSKAATGATKVSAEAGRDESEPRLLGRWLKKLKSS